MSKLLDKIVHYAKRSPDPRKVVVKMLLCAHGWKLRPRNSACWHPPGSDITFGAPITVEDLRRRGYGAIADQFLSVENMLANWAKSISEEQA